MPASFLILAFLVQLSTSFLTAQAAEPNCTHVADFQDCPGNVHDFCRKGIACGCKDQKPFCKCPVYRSGWEDYWYIGPKCDQLWSTLDLILVAAVPAVALALAAAVIVQWVGYCKSKPGESRARAKYLKPEGHLNPAYVPNLYDNSRNISQQKGNKDAVAAQYVRFPRLPVERRIPEQSPFPARVGGFSYAPHQRVVPVERGPLVNQRGAWGTGIPDVDYEDVNPFSAMPMQQFPKAVMSVYPQYE